MRMFLLSASDDLDVLIWLIGIPLGFFIMYKFYYFATGANERKQQLKILNNTLLHLAKKQGVDQDTIDILNKLNEEV